MCVFMRFTVTSLPPLRLCRHARGFIDRKTKKGKERQKRKEIDVRWWPQEPESGGEAQALVRPARDRGLPLPKTCEARVVASAQARPREARTRQKKPLRRQQ